ncbi:Hsp20/alpha crystallin family protein [Siminovitchia sp. FSL H7-0308]|uniref:Hsp20/alpha crystallin family protein n=1 Tax=Siminovitchia sp. FSL H7-0308 TaxID=2921432 RepID=UPI0030EB8435
MDFEKIKQWMEITQKYQNGKFWETIFDGNSFDEDEETSEVHPLQSKNKSDPKKYPKTDIYVTETDVVVLMEIPGALKEDIALSVSGSKLSVKGVLQPPMINGASVLNERKYGEFQRNIDLPEPVDSKDIYARFKNPTHENIQGKRTS